MASATHCEEARLDQVICVFLNKSPVYRTTMRIPQSVYIKLFNFPSQDLQLLQLVQEEVFIRRLSPQEMISNKTIVQQHTLLKI